MARVEFEIEFLNDDVVDTLRKLPRADQALIYKTIEQKLKLDPLLCGKTLKYSYKEYRRLMISKYRIVYNIELLTILILDVHMRKNIYYKEEEDE